MIRAEESVIPVSKRGMYLEGSPHSSRAFVLELCHRYLCQGKYATFILLIRSARDACWEPQKRTGHFPGVCWMPHCFSQTVGLQFMRTHSRNGGSGWGRGTPQRLQGQLLLLLKLSSFFFFFLTPTAPGIPRWSPIQVLTRPDPAQLLRLNGIELVQGSMAIDWSLLYH